MGKHIAKIGLRLASIAALAFLFAACGKQTFDRQQFTASYTANQYVTVKPKVDIIIFQDDSASMFTPFNTFKAQLNTFLTSINANWDFHFAVLPLLRNDDLRNRWIVASNCLGITYCLTPSQISFFDNGSGWYAPTNSSTAADQGFRYMQENLSNTNSMISSGFLRSDAMLVVIPFTNGQDLTGMLDNNGNLLAAAMKDRGDGTLVPNFTSSYALNSLSAFYNFMASFKSNISQLNFFSVAGGNRLSNPDGQFSCYSGSTYPGTRYHQISYDLDNAYPGAINGGQYDICSGQLNSVLSTISGRMQDVILTIEFNYIVVAERPIPSSIKISKNGVAIPQSTTNGWSLYNVSGGVHQYTSNKATSFAPYEGNYQSGYFIQLNGTARFKGSDTISITYDKY